MSQAAAFDPYAMPADALREPPASLSSALRQIGPGIILAGSIIGTGELLLTTKLGADHGFLLLWLILFSCIIKVFVQVELGRYAISSGKPTLSALDEMPGPRFGTHWLVWWWFFMLLATVSQLGGMLGGVGQAMHLLLPQVNELVASLAEYVSPGCSEFIRRNPADPWALATAIVAVTLLLSGGYRRIEFLTTFLVAAVTLVTVACVAALPFSGFPISANEIKQGFSFTIPATAVTVAFSAFGITGVGASELYSYPYWCLEKGYARYSGSCTPDEGWARRAKGWMRVLTLDAWVSMLVFTVATVAFYTMGATVLHRLDLHPQKQRLMEDLAQMYVQAFGHPWTKTLFLIGASVVLFKTLYVSVAGNSRLTADFLGLVRVVHYDAGKRARCIRFLCAFYPGLALVLYLAFGDPQAMVVFGAFAQGATLPVITAATIYLRFRRTDPRLAPSLIMDGCLWLAFFAISGGAIYSVRTTIVDNWPMGDRKPIPNERTSLRLRGETAATSSLAEACHKTADDIRGRLGQGSAAIVRAPFVVAGDLGEDELGRWHESTIRPAARAISRRYLTTAPDEPITVLLFADRAAYERQAVSLFGDTHVSRYGYYKPHLRTLVINAGSGAGALVHELTHALVDFDFPDAPDWFDEGLAALHEACRVRLDEPGIDALVNWRLAGLQRTIHKGRLRSLEAMMLDDRFRGRHVGLNYAHARYFCMYLQSDRNPCGRDVLAELYRELRAGRRNDPQGARTVLRYFPECSWAELDRAFCDYVLSLEDPVERLAENAARGNP
jgi:Mn2+/Fe2+ NRAMP family transporter